MTASEIVRIVATVGVVQLVCDLVAHWRVYSQIPYQRALERLSRCQHKVSQLQAKGAVSAATSAAALVGHTAKATTTTTTTTTTTKQHEKQFKTLQRALDDQSEALSNVAQRHTAPSIMTSMIFLILMRVLGTDCQGRIIALLPFIPYAMFHGLTGRGLQFPEAGNIDSVEWMEEGPVSSLMQAASFTLVYVLATASVKYYVHQLISTKPPVGAESLMAMVDSPQGHKIMKAVGIDPKDLKTE